MSKGVTMTMTEEQRDTEAEVACGICDYAPEEVREDWVRLADEVERRQADLAAFIDRLQVAYANHSVATGKAFLRLGEDWTDKLDDALREATGFERLARAVHAAGLFPSVEDRTETPEEAALYQQSRTTRSAS